MSPLGLTSIEICERLIFLDSSYCLLGLLGISREYSLGYCDKRLYDISKEVTLLQARLRFLALEEESGRIAKLRAKNRLQPFGRLPSEVISSILLFSMKRFDGSIWRSPELAVSHRWRYCALNDAMIWKHIRIVASTREEELVAWLARSRNAQLSINYDFSRDDESLQEHFTMTQSLIALHAGRIRRLNYNVGLPTNVLFPLSVAPPSLEALSVLWAESSSAQSFHLFGEKAPSGLRKLRLAAYGAPSPVVILNGFDASALVTLHVTKSVNPRSIWSTLSRSHLLEELEWFGVMESEVEGLLDVAKPGRAPVTLKHLRSLTLGGSHTRLLLANLEVPVLEWLDIVFLSARQLQNVIPEILPHSQLQRLTLCFAGPLQANQLRDIFTALHNLEYFIHDDWTAESIPALEILTPPAMIKSQSNMRSWHGSSLHVLYIGNMLQARNIRTESPAYKEFVQAMNKHIRPLLSRRRIYASQPLTVVVNHTEMLDGLLGLEGIQWASSNHYHWPVK